MSHYNPYFVSTKRIYPVRQQSIGLDYFAGVFLTTLIVFTQNMGSEAFRVDRFQHFGVSLLLFLVFATGLKGVRGQYYLSFFLAFLVGVSKEIFDHQGDIGDIYANSCGILVGCLILLATSFAFASRRS